MNHSNIKSSTKKRTKAIVSVFLVVAILIAGAYAFLSATDSKTNVFTVGNVNIELWEKFDTDLSGTLDADEFYGSTVTEVPIDADKSIIPGQTILKQPMIKNTGKNPAYLYMAVGVPTATEDNIKTNNLGDKVNIVVKAFGIQENYKNKTTATDIWNAYFDAAKATSVLGASVENTEEELFTLNKTTDSGWSEVSTYRVDGYVYHIFALDNAMGTAGLVDGYSTSPFESVTLNEFIGVGTSTDTSASDLVISAGDVVPDDCTLTLASGTVYETGETVPSDYVPEEDDEFETSDYIYTYYYGNDSISKEDLSDTPTGWGVYAKDETKTSYEPLLESLFGKELKDASECFSYCTNMVQSPVIPDSVVDLDKTFDGCSSLTTVTNIPTNAQYLRTTFRNCKSLTSIPTLPAGILYMYLTFDGCASLTSVTYQGTVSDWANIKGDGDIFTSSATIICSDGTVTI